MDSKQEVPIRKVTGGVDTHKDLHVAAIVDEHDVVLGSEFFPTNRHGYKQMINWMRSEEHTSELQYLMRHSYDALCLKKKQPVTRNTITNTKLQYNHSSVNYKIIKQ